MEQSQDDQLVRDLLRPENLPGGPSETGFTATHGSLVFLTEKHVFKVKRAKDYGFFDFTTLEARKHYCSEEVRLNRRTAPGVYLDVVPVFQDSQGYSLTRPGEVVDYAVHMVRLPDDRSALSLLNAGRLGHGEIRGLARFVARFYRNAEAMPAIPDALAKSIHENFAQVRPLVDKPADESLRKTLSETQRLQEQWLLGHKALLESRACRDGHGDLRLEHVYFLDEGPLVIDCIEFLDRFRVGDPALDAAFLSMDLYRHREEGLAESFLGQFAYESDDYDFYPLVDGYMSYRATVRGKVAFFVAADPSTSRERAARKEREAREHLDLAHRFLAVPRKGGKVIGVGGIIASGKTTVAETLADHLGAPVVSADATRKFLAGIDKEEHGDPSIYDPDFTTRVEHELLRRARLVLEAGRTVLLDTTFKTRKFRGQARRLADEMNMPFLMIECHVTPETARERLAKRRAGVSDARQDLLDSFLASYEPIAELSPNEHVRVDGTSTPEQILEELQGRGVIDPA